MNRLLILLLPTALLSASIPGEADLSASPHAKVRSIGMNDARWTTGFWGERMRLARSVIAPGIRETYEKKGNGSWIGNLRIAAGLEKGEFDGNNWSDGDIYKWVEAASLLYAAQPDEKLLRQMEEIVALAAKAQRSDGYLSTNIQLTKRQRWANPRNHEVYNMTHMMHAAVAHHRATGKNDFLSIARRAADYLYDQFRSPSPEKSHFSAPSDLMGLMELYRVTREPRYLDLVQTMVDMRGTQTGGSDQFQDRVPLRRATTAVGHAMHATYFYAIAADLFAERGEKALFDAVERLWTDVNSRRIAVTGAVGPLDPGLTKSRDIVAEAFGKDYETPQREGYNEICANIGNAMWNRRMLALTGEARFAGVMETVLYNAMLQGMTVDGERFCYTAVHRRFGEELPRIRNESLLRWHDTTEAGAARSYCCPPNLLRTMLKTAEWSYGVGDQALWVHLYGAGELETAVPGTGRVKLVQTTDYPWSGVVRFNVQAASQGEWSLMLRVPEWAAGARVNVNGSPWRDPLRPGSYAALRRAWKAGDRIELELPMEARLIEGHPYNEFTRGQVAVARGPIVYCLESPDLPQGVRVDEIRLNAVTRFSPRHRPDLLGGVTILEGSARRAHGAEWGNLLYRTLQRGSEMVPVKLMPYYAWGNRGVSHMTVWMPLGD